MKKKGKAAFLWHSKMADFVSLATVFPIFSSIVYDTHSALLHAALALFWLRLAVLPAVLVGILL
jgi:hypothetical protein